MSRNVTLAILNFFFPSSIDETLAPSLVKVGEKTVSPTVPNDIDLNDVVSLDLSKLRSFLEDENERDDKFLKSKLSNMLEKILDLGNTLKASEDQVFSKYNQVFQTKLIKDLDDASNSPRKSTVSNVPVVPAKSKEKHPLDSDVPFIVTDAQRHNMILAQKEYSDLVEKTTKGSSQDEVKSDLKIVNIVLSQIEEHARLLELQEKLSSLESEKGRLLLEKELLEEKLREQEHAFEIRLKNQKETNEASIKEIRDIYERSQSFEDQNIILMDSNTSASYQNAVGEELEKFPIAESDSLGSIDFQNNPMKPSLQNQYPDEIRLSDENVDKKPEKVTEEQPLTNIKTINNEEDLEGSFVNLKSQDVDYPSTLSLVDDININDSKKDEASSSKQKAPKSHSFIVSKGGEKKGSSNIGDIESWSDDIELVNLDKLKSFDQDAKIQEDDPSDFSSSSKSASDSISPQKEEIVPDENDENSWDKDFADDETIGTHKIPAQGIAAPIIIHNLAEERAKARKEKEAEQEIPKNVENEEESWEDEFDDAEISKLTETASNTKPKARRKLSQEPYYANPILRNDPQVNAQLKRKEAFKKKKSNNNLKKDEVD